MQEDKRLYRDEFDGDDIYIVSPSAYTDKKIRTLIEEQDIPASNVFEEYNENELDNLYEILKDEFNMAIEEKEIQLENLKKDIYKKVINRLLKESKK